MSRISTSSGPGELLVELRRDTGVPLHQQLESGIRDADPGRSAARRHGDAVDPGARARPRAVPWRGRRGLSTAGRRGVPGQPGRRLHAGRRHRRGRAFGGEAVAERSAADRLPLQPAGRLAVPARRLAPVDPPGAERDAVPQPRLPGRSRHHRTADGAGRLPEPGPRYGGPPGEHADLQRIRPGIALAPAGPGRPGLSAARGRGPVGQRPAGRRGGGRSRGRRRTGAGVGDRCRRARAVRS